MKKSHRVLLATISVVTTSFLTTANGADGSRCNEKTIGYTEAYRVETPFFETRDAALNYLRLLAENKFFDECKARFSRGRLKPGSLMYTPYVQGMELGQRARYKMSASSILGICIYPDDDSVCRQEGQEYNRLPPVPDRDIEPSPEMADILRRLPPRYQTEPATGTSTANATSSPRVNTGGIRYYEESGEQLDDFWRGDTQEQIEQRKRVAQHQTVADSSAAQAASTSQPGAESTSKPQTAPSRPGLSGTYTNAETGKTWVFRDGMSQFIQYKSINGNPGTITIDFTWSLNSDNSQLSYHQRSIKLEGSGGYDRQQSLDKRTTDKIEVRADAIVMGGVVYTRQ